jgi:SnoaL-like domain
VDRATFDDYIRRFNEQDLTAFEDYLAPDMHMLDGSLEYTGVQGMKDHCTKIWGTFTERLHVLRYVADDSTIAVRTRTDLEAFRDDEDSAYGPVARGTGIRSSRVAMYEVADGKFADICVAHTSFVMTTPDGLSMDLGIPH